jgi:transposase
MRGEGNQPGGIFSYRTAEERIAPDYPLRPMRRMVDEALQGLSPLFARMYWKNGRPSIWREKLLRALLLQVLYTIRSERQWMEQLDYNILYRWFVGLDTDEAVWDVTVFTKNRERLLKSEVADGFFDQVLQQPRGQQLLWADQFTVDGTLIEAWAGRKSFQRKDR